jgi:hypothetical protein
MDRCDGDEGRERMDDGIVVGDNDGYADESMYAMHMTIQ